MSDKNERINISGIQKMKSTIEFISTSEEEKININLEEAIILVLEIAEDFIKESKAGSIGRNHRIKSAVSYLHQYIEGKGALA